LVEESGKAASTVSFGTEAGQMASLGAETVVFGPGNIQNAHQTGEFVPIDELVRAEQILERAIAHFCG
jgi:acetylornithine deacetylase